MSFGLLDTDIKFICSSLSQFEEIEKTALFGSRAKGNSKRGSDVDIAIWENKINFATISKLHAILEDYSPMPYLFDIVDYTHLSHKDIKEYINKVGIIIYQKGKLC
jgi:predicted nucleotidyltransferase